MITVLAPGQRAESRNGLPQLGRGECLYFASFRVLTEKGVLVEGIVAAGRPGEAGARLMSAEAFLRGVSYDTLFRQCSLPAAIRITEAEALAMLPRPATVLPGPRQAGPARGAACVGNATPAHPAA